MKNKELRSKSKKDNSLLFVPELPLTRDFAADEALKLLSDD